MLKSVGNAARTSIFLFAFLSLAACGSPEDRAQSYYERGMKLIEENDFARASLEIRNALKLKEDMTQAWVALSRIEEHNQNWDAVGRILRRIVSLDPKNVDARVRLSRLLFLAGNYDEALKLADAAMAIERDNAATRSLRAAILFKNGDAAGAVQEAEASLSLDADNAEALIVLAANLLSRGDSEGALLILDRGGANHDKNVAIQLLKIKVLEARRDLSEIERVLQKLAEFYPNELVFRRQLVRFYMQHNRSAEAEKQLRATADSDLGNSEAGLDVVRFLQTTKGADAARMELLARINRPGNVLPYQLALVDFYAAQGNTGDAVQLLESIIASSKSAEDVQAANVKLAGLHLVNKRSAEADAIVEKVLAQDRRNIGALKLRSVIQIDKGQYDAAIGNLREGLNDQPRDTELLTLLAAAFERSGSMELADERLSYATRISNFDPKVGLQYVAFLRRRGNAARAEDILQQLAGRSPGNHDILIGLAQAKLARRDWTGAQEIADNILRIGTNPVLANQIRGEALAGQQKFDESISVLQAASDARPEAVQPMFALVRAYVRAQKFDEAEAFLNRVVADSPANAEARVILGSVKIARNQTEQAQKIFSAAISQHPKNSAAYRALAGLYMRQGKNEEALKVVRAALIEQPDEAALRLSLAQLLELGGDFEGAIREYELLVQREPGSVVYANNLASLLLDHRTDAASLEKASALAARLRKSPVGQFKDTLGWLHYRRGEFKASIALLEEASRELPNMPIIQYHLGLSYVADGQPEKGVERLKKALELVPNGGVSEKAVRSAMEKAGVM